jgi:hypothetical protein
VVAVSHSAIYQIIVFWSVALSIYGGQPNDNFVSSVAVE